MQSKSSSSYDSELARAGFAQIYADGKPPWEIGKPQPPFVAVADQVKGPVLDAGCGTGNTALLFAAKGLQVTGIDFVEGAIKQAREKAAKRGLATEFLVKDAMTLCDWDRRFVSVIDSGLFHVYSGDTRRKYVAGLTKVTQPGGRLYLFSFHRERNAGVEETPGTVGLKDVPPTIAAAAATGGISAEDLAHVFADGWVVESAEITSGEIDPAHLASATGGHHRDIPKMIFAVLQRQG
jgi:SAM-dependent methyltransferase